MKLLLPSGALVGVLLPLALPAAAAPSHRVAPAASPIQIDGQLDEPAWQRAAVVPLTHETDPGENVPPPVATECFVTYDERHFYVAFRALDPDPAAIRARFADRDTAWDDDLVGITLDPFNDERRAFQFFVNPLGVQLDVFLDDLSDSDDDSWDALWESAGQVSPTGYTVEMAIPFSSLRFRESEETQTWGFEALRFYPRDRRHRIASQSRDRNISCHLCQISKLEGFGAVEAGRNVELTPTVTASRTEEREGFPSGGFSSQGTESEVGISARWGITPNLNLNLTLNPDFSQVEADSAQLSVNEQFALFFPERRPFFQEGADFFSTRLSAVFTRNVADPEWGVKLSGKVGKNAIGLFAAEDAVTNLLIPGKESSEAATLDLVSTDLVARYRRDLGKTSAIGLLATDRSGGSYQNSVAGFDGVLRPTDVDTFNVQFLGSTTQYPESFAREFGQPHGDFEDWAGHLSYSHDSRDWEAYARYEHVGRDFRADMGFLPQVDYDFYLAGLRRNWIGDPEDFWSRIELGGDYDYREDDAGNLLEREVELNVEGSGPRQSFVLFGGLVRTRVFQGVAFDQVAAYSYLEMRPIADLYVWIDASGGDAVDFANVQAGDQVTLRPGITYNFGRRLRTQLVHTFRRLDVEAGRLFTANLSELRLTYQFNLRTFLRAVFQYTDIDRDPSLYDDEVDAKTETLFSQLLFSYKLNPQTVFFLGYSDSALGDEEIDLARKDRTLFLKIGYAWVL